jgi:thiamine transporter ThiT
LTVAVDLFNSVLVFAVIAALGPLRIVTRATAISVVVMLVVTTVGALRFGPAGALAGLLTGLIARVALELRALRDSG